MNARTTITTLALLLTSASASAGTITFVAPGQGTLQAAINAAAPGDTLQLGGGTYSGALVINKDLTIEGLHYDASIIDCPNAEFGVRVTGDADVHLDSLRVTGANQVAGVFIEPTASAELSTVMLTRNVTALGAILNFGDTLIDDDSIIGNNVGTSTAGGITNVQGDLHLDGVTVIGNQGYLGAGLHNSVGYALIENSSFSGNYATSLGGGYSNHNYGGTVDFDSSSSFSANASATGTFEDCYDINQSAGCVQ